MAILHGDDDPQLRHILEVVYVQVPLRNLPASTSTQADSALSEHISGLCSTAPATTSCVIPWQSVLLSLFPAGLAAGTASYQRMGKQ